ncbi:MAG: hypothetical protein ABSG67_03930 [Thermoguttaceae bacterium]|jgi:uncharacterized repeat protein (TIGR01451 family)
MKRLFLRIGVLATFVVLGLIAYAYAQRGAGERYPSDDGSVENASPLRGPDAQNTSPNYTLNPLRDNTLRAEPAVDNSFDRTPVVDSRVKRVAADTPATDSGARPAGDPFGLALHKGGATIKQAAGQTLPNNSIPDAAALDPPPTGYPLAGGGADQSRYSQLAGPNLNSQSGAGPSSNRGDAENNAGYLPSKQSPSYPPMVEQYPAGGGAADRSVAVNRSGDGYNEAGNLPDRQGAFGKTADRYGNRPTGTTALASNGLEPGPFKADPSSAPRALSQTGEKGADRNLGANAGNLAADGFANSEGTGQPGSKQLEGAQTPQVTIQKFAPNEIQVGKPAVFKIAVRNTGSIPAGQVEIRDQTPRGTKLLGTTPRASQGPRGEIVWTIGTLRPGEESSVEMELLPTAEGEIGSVATVHFGADASARTISTRPKLALEMSAAEKVLIGEQVVMSIVVSNPGTGVATGVVLEEHLPAGLQHPAGAELEYEVGDLRPGESKKLDLPMAAVSPGQAVNVLTARADGNLQAQERLDIQVVAPKLDIAMEGPKRRYLEKEAVYQVSVSNPGTAAAQQVELVAYLPPGLKFVSANNSGHYDDASRAVHWRLQELPSNEIGAVELVTMPVESGQQSIKLRGTAAKGLAVEKEQPVLVEGIASIVFQPMDVTGPIEVGGETVYEVRVVNQGSKAASNVRLTVLLPSEMQAMAAEGPTRHAIEPGRIVFEGLARLAPKADANYRIKAKGIRPGDLRTRFQLVTDEMQTPVTKEESTRVYADE